MTDPLVLPFNLTDLGNAERLAARHLDDLCYVAAWKSWLLWDGTRWKLDNMRKVEDKAHGTIRAIIAQAATLPAAQHEALVKFALASERDHGIRGMLNRAGAMPEFARAPDVFDADPMILNVLNGTLDLTMPDRSLMLKGHNRADNCTKIANVRFEPDARCPRWLAFLDQIMGGRQDVIDFLQEAYGYTLTGSVAEQCLFFLHGGGQNGKSTFLNVLRDLLGDYATPSDFATFIERKNDAGPRNDIARLAGSRMVTAIEAGEGHRLAEAVVKNLTGGDKIAARRLYEESFEFTPQFALWLASNHKPIIVGTDEGIWRRIRLIPFTVTISEDAKDRDLEAKLAAERPGILNWALEGLLRWRARGRLAEPAVVRDATRDYRTASDILGQFLDERCEFERGYSVASTELHTAYAEWCEKRRERTMTQTKFGTSLEERGIASDRLGNIRYRLGLKLRPRDAGPPPGSPGCPPILESPLTRAHRESPRNGPQPGEPGETTPGEQYEIAPDAADKRTGIEWVLHDEEGA